MLDLVIRHATVYDGSGERPFMGSVGVRDGRIVAVDRSDMPELDARETVDAAGLALCPGFADTHTHSDMVLLHDGR